MRVWPISGCLFLVPQIQVFHFLILESTGLKSSKISSERKKTPSATPMPPSVVSHYYLHSRGKSFSHHLEQTPRKNSLHLANFVGVRASKTRKAEKEDRAVSLYTAGRKI